MITQSKILLQFNAPGKAQNHHSLVSNIFLREFSTLIIKT